LGLSKKEEASNDEDGLNLETLKPSRHRKGRSDLDEVITNALKAFPDYFSDMRKALETEAITAEAAKEAVKKATQDFENKVTSQIKGLKDLVHWLEGSIQGCTNN
jgi:hypothetical protein